MSLKGTEQRKIPSLAATENVFFESILPVKAFATLTTKHVMTRETLNEMYLLWLRGIQKYERSTLGWVRAMESVPKLHIHAALVAARPIDCARAAALWQAMTSPRYTEAARVEPYRCGSCGLGYILKTLESPSECIRYSDNIAAFAKIGGRSLFRTCAAERRQHRRIRAQIERFSNGRG